MDIGRINFFAISCLLIICSIAYSQQFKFIAVNDDKEFTLNIYADLQNQTIYVSAVELGKIFNARIFYNPKNKKIELTLTNKSLKFSPNNPFVVYEDKSLNERKIYQYPISCLEAKEDIFIPLEFAILSLENFIQKKIQIDKISRRIIFGSEKLIAQKLEDKEEDKKQDGNPEEESSKIESSFEVYDMSIEEKANGILIKLYSKKELRKFTSGISDNTLYLTIMGVGVDIERISKARPKGLIKKIDVKKLAQSYQISFSLNEGYSTSETYFDKNKKELVITIHNRYIENIKNTDLKGSKIDVIVIDAGHGGRDPGAIGINGLKEKDINLSVALELGALLKAEYPEVKIVYTRTTDEYIDLYKRGKIANEAEGKLFISIHCNSSKNKDLTGSEVYFLGISRTAEAIAIAEKENSVIAYEEDNERYKELTNENFILATMAHAAYTKFSERFAEIVNEKFGNDLPYPARGVRQAGFYVLVGASMPSVLLEIGYLSNKFDADYLRSYTNRKTIARSIFESIKIFKEEYEKETLGQK